MRRVTIGLLATLISTTGCNHAGDVPTDEPLVAPVVAFVAAPHQFTERVDGSGIVAALPERVHVVTPLYAGRVARLLAHVGASVTTGDLLGDIMLDPAIIAEIAKLRRSVELADRTLERQRRAVDAGVSPRVALEQAEIDAANAKAEFEARTRNYDATSQRLMLRAPISGLVTAIDVHLGQEVDANTNAVTIVDPEALAAEVRFDAVSSARIEVGQRATLVPLQPGAADLRATVLRRTAVLDPLSQRVAVWLKPDGDPLAPGTFVRASVEIGLAERVAVPRSALVKTDKGYQVFVLDATAAHAREVSVGTIDDDLAAIREGLAAGETVASEGAQELTDGARIAVQDRGS